jgi:hypothetical protein
MRIKGKPFVIALLVLLCVVMFFSKEVLLKSYLTHYLRTRLGGQCSIEHLNLSRNSIAATGVHLEHEYFRLDIGRLKIDFAFPEFIKPRLEHIAVSGADINIKSLTQAQAALKKLIGGSSLTAATPASGSDKEPPKYSLALDDISLALKENDLYLNTGFSFAGVISSQVPLIELKQLRVDSFKLHSGAVSFAFRVEPAGDNRIPCILTALNGKIKRSKTSSCRLRW